MCKDGTLQQSKIKSDRKPIRGASLRGLSVAVGSANDRSDGIGITIALQADSAPRHCWSIFEDSGYFSFMICENLIPMSSPVFKHLTDLFELVVVLLRRDPDTLDGRVLFAVPLKRVLRAKKSPQRLPKEIFKGCASIVSQWRL